jgi:ABC-2 type transport system ATP-binding protein
MISVVHLTRQFGSFRAVDDVSFELERGEVVGFLGPNGAGKTTTMRMLTGFLPATSGSIEVAGHDVFRDSLAVRKRIGYLPESVPLYREHRVEEMLAFQARLHRMPRVAARRRIGEVLERVGMPERRRSLIGTLSKGQRQRVGLAVALLPDPEVLILDEPTSGLDPLQRVEVRGLIRELAEERTVLLSSHILPEVEAVCPRVIVLHRGRIAADGPQEELLVSLGSQAFVHVELACPDPAACAQELSALPGSPKVLDRGGVGEHHRFDLESDADLRAAVGELAARNGWTLRELSWQQPTLERVFAKIALDLDGAGEVR